MDTKPIILKPKMKMTRKIKCEHYEVKPAIVKLEPRNFHTECSNCKILQKEIDFLRFYQEELRKAMHHHFMNIFMKPEIISERKAHQAADKRIVQHK